MFRRECSLCGGKLNRDNICQECGLDNTKSDANYILNQSSCDNQPMTHVHEEKKKPRREKKVKTNKKANQQSNQRAYQNTYSANKYAHQEKPKKRGKFVAKAGVIVVILSILGELVSIIPDIISDIGDSGFSEITEVFEEDFSYEPEYEAEYDYDPYEDVTREIPAEGEEYTASLYQGEYIVGVHIPEGIYTCRSEEYCSIDVEDDENSIWMYEWVDDETPEVNDIRLYTGAVIEIYGDGLLEMTTSNAQMSGMVSQPNPLTETIGLDMNGMETGLNFEPGVYDIKAEGGYGSINVIIYDEFGEVLDEKYLWLDADKEETSIYKNLVLPEGAVIIWEQYDEMILSLTPSEVISGTDYLEYYEY